jgi:hypothetical protein
VRFVLALSIILAGTSHAGTRPDEAGDEIIRRTEEYIASLQELLALYEEGARSAARAFEQRRGLYGSGLVSRQDFEASGRALEETRARLEDVSNRIVESSILISEVRLSQELAVGREQKPSVKDVAVFHPGKAAWKLADISRIEDFYLKRFGVPLPVSALGQTALHTRMGFDHRDAADVALHPDSPEGLQLIEFLRTSGVSFIAFREALPDSATGAHIHIGQPSARLTVAGAPPLAFTDRSGS